MPFAGAGDYPLWLNALIFVAAAAVIWPAGTRLARYLSELSTLTGLGQAFVGMLLMGSITSLPEVANCLTSAYIGNPALAVNNLLGSASINVALLAVGDAAIGRDALTSVVARPATLMQAVLCLLLFTIVAIAITVGDVQVAGVGLWAVGLAALSIGSFWLAAGYDKRSPWELADSQAAQVPGEADSKSDAGGNVTLGTLIVKITIAGIVIFAAGYSLAQAGDALADQTGLGTGLVGFLLIGGSTSLPELSSITGAIRLRKYELAIGEILGTNFVNIALILLADAVFTGGPVIEELGGFEVVSALLGSSLVALYIVGLLEHRNPVVLRMGYDSLAVLLTFAGGVALLFTLR